MADLAPTAANVVPGSDAVKAAGTYGGTVTAGMPVYSKAADSNKLYPADNNVTLVEATVVGIALNSGSAGQPAVYQSSGLITLGAITAGAAAIPIALSATAGGMCPDADVASTNNYTLLGVLVSATVLKLGIINTGITHP